jgi:Domain of unknown function (DUF1772)
VDIVFGHLALVIAAVFAGAAIYVSVAEQPARLKLDDQALLAVWKSSYKRGFAMQAPLAVLGFLCGVLAWYDKGEGGYLWGGVLMILNWPWTLLAMWPTNKKLMALDERDRCPEARALIRRWGRLHMVRAALGVAATIVFFMSCVAP